MRLCGCRQMGSALRRMAPRFTTMMMRPNLEDGMTNNGNPSATLW